MVRFRLITGFVLGVTFAGIATAQINGSGGGGAFTCSANVANPAAARATSYADLIGDIVITCTGGVNPAAGSAVPTANITVALNDTIVTSRVFGNGLSEALLLIDEPGATGATGPGTLLPQAVCSGGTLGAGAGGCETYANLVSGGSRASMCTALSSGVCTSFGTTPNVFQGVVNGNQVVFNGVPILAPVTAGLARVFRITNVRADATVLAVGPGPFQGQVPILASISISSLVTLQNAVQTTAFVFDGLQSTPVRNATNTADGSGINLQQCGTGGLQAGAVLRFNEKFGNAFKTRISANGTLSGAGTPGGSVTVASSFQQNVPGTIYNGSESGLMVPVTGGTAGLTDFGTRLKATFLNVPAGVEIYVSTTNINPLGNNGVNPTSGDLTVLDAVVASGNFASSAGVSLLAGLVTSETATAAPGGALPLRAATNTAGNIRLFGPLPVDGNGTATAVWETLLADPTHLQTAEFAVYYRQTGAPPLSPAGTVALSMAPTYSSAGAGTAVPRLSPPSTTTNLINVSGCPAVTVGLTWGPTPSTFGQVVTFTAAVTGATGTATFKDGGATMGTASIAGGVATFATAGLSAGTHFITATAGVVTSSPVTHVVNKASTTAALNTGGSAISGQGAIFTATVTSSGGVATGAVTFRDGATTIGAGVLDGSGTARLFNVILPVGLHTITATYGGDANFNGSSGTQGFSVNLPSSSVSTPVLRSGTPAAGASLTFAATVNGEGGPLTGSVTFQDFQRTLGSSAMDASGTATVTTTLAAGTHYISASYSGDAGRSGSTSGVLVLTIKAAPSVTVTSSANPAEAAAPITLTANVAGAAGLPSPTGIVTFGEGSTTLGSATVDGSAKATLTLANGFPTGDHTITAAYGGDANYEAASGTLTQRVNKIATSTTLLQGSGSAGFYLTALVASTMTATPTGSVQFEDATAGAALGSAALANGRAVPTISGALPVGHTARAVYSGDERFAGSTSAGLRILGAVNAFSFAPTFVPDGVGSIFGVGLAGGTATAEGFPLPTTLGGVRVVFMVAEDGYPAGLYYVSPGQINFVVPGGMPIGPALLIVATPDGTRTLEVAIVQSGPALASANGSGSGAAAGQVIRMHRDGSQEAPVTVSAGTVAWGSAGDRLFLVLYGTGLRHAAGVSCSLNGAPVATMYAGAHATYPGLDQVNLEIPAGLRGTLTVQCSAQGVTSNAVTVGVE